MNRAHPCTLCQSTEHSSKKCPELVKELETGFYKPAGGYQQGGEDDESLNTVSPSFPLLCVFIQNNTCCNSNIQGSQNPILANTNNRCIKSL